MELKDELTGTMTLLPLFFTNGLFKVLSQAVIIACLRYISIPVILFNAFTFGFPLVNIPQRKVTCCPKRFRWQDGDIDCTSLQFKEDGTEREKLENCVNTNFHWAISHLIVLTSIVAAANVSLDSFTHDSNNFNLPNATGDHLLLKDNNTMVNQSDIDVLHSTPAVQIRARPSLVENLPLLNGLYIVTLAAIVINAVLFYVQMWKPMAQEEEQMDSGYEDEV